MNMLNNKTKNILTMNERKEESQKLRNNKEQKL